MSQCAECPWRDTTQVPEYALMAAAQGANDWTCHVRMGPCPGPDILRREFDREQRAT